MSVPRLAALAWLAGAPFILIALLTAAAPTRAAADRLAPVHIHASRPNAAADISPEESTSPVRVVERSAFEHRITTLADTLADQTGVQIRQAGGLGSLSTVSMRGASGKQVQVFLDGMLLNDPLHGNVDLSLFSLHDVARIQVYPGNPPARVPQAGPGGVILMESLGADTRPQTRLNLGTGSFGTQRQGLFNSNAHGRFHYWLSLNRQAADNDFRYPNRAEWLNPVDGRWSRRRNADIEQYDVSLHTGYQFDGARRLSLLLQLVDKDQGIPTPQNWQSNTARLDNRTHRAQLHYQDQSSFNGRLHRSHRLTFARTDERYRDIAGRVGLGQHDLLTDTQHIGLINTLSWIQDSHLISASLEASHYDQTEINHLRPNPESQRERWLLAAALSHEWLSEDARLRTQAVVRHTQLRDDALETLLTGAQEENRQHTRFPGWQLGLRYQLFTPLELYANLNRQARIPTLLERFGQQGLFVGNRDLLPEEALSAELGSRLTFARGHLDITGFWRKLDPAIVTVFDARGTGRSINVEAEFHGVETEILYALTPRWTLSGNATVQESENTSTDIASHAGKRVPGIYHQSASVRSQWTLAPLQLHLSWHIDDALYYDAPNIRQADTRRMLNAGVAWLHTWSAHSETRIDLSVRNIEGTHYQDFNRFPGAGRAWFLTLQHTL